jgi:hypothetical protein
MISVTTRQPYGFDTFDRGRVEVVEGSPLIYSKGPALYMNCAATVSQGDVVCMKSKNDSRDFIYFKKRLCRSDLSLLF